MSVFPKFKILPLSQWPDGQKMDYVRNGNIEILFGLKDGILYIHRLTQINKRRLKRIP